MPYLDCCVAVVSSTAFLLLLVLLRLLSAAVVNWYRMLSDIKSYNPSGMGYAASLLAIDMDIIKHSSLYKLLKKPSYIFEKKDAEITGQYPLWGIFPPWAHKALVRPLWPSPMRLISEPMRLISEISLLLQDCRSRLEHTPICASKLWLSFTKTHAQSVWAFLQQNTLQQIHASKMKQS